MRLRSNLGRASGIERPREVGRGAAAICRRRGGSRGGGLAGDAQTGAPGVNLTRAWVREVQGGMRNPLESRARVRDGRSIVSGGGGGSAWQSIAGDGG
jgi:hypothetical protein